MNLVKAGRYVSSGPPHSSSDRTGSRGGDRAGCSLVLLGAAVADSCILLAQATTTMAGSKQGALNSQNSKTCQR
jgi:hypothetical protein